MMSLLRNIVSKIEKIFCYKIIFRDSEIKLYAYQKDMRLRAPEVYKTDVTICIDCWLNGCVTTLLQLH